MIKIRRNTVIGCTALACILSTANGQDIFFSNSLQNETSALTAFNENLGPEGSWGFSTNLIITVLNPTNTAETISRTNTTAGASVFATGTNDNDAVRSYLATQFGGYMFTNENWKAHIALETPATGDPTDNYIFIGVGNGLPSGANGEPVDGDRAYIRWRHGSTASYGRPRTYVNTASTTDGSGITGPGCDVYMTYYAETKLIKFELDDWSDGRTNGIYLTSYADVSALTFTDNTEARIFFGGNATITYSDFSVEPFEITTPDAPQNLYAWPDSNNIVTVRWDEDSLATSGYNVYRSLDDVAPSYTLIASGLTVNAYVDTDVTNGVTYYYKASSVNENGASEPSISEYAIPTPYFIIGSDDTDPLKSKYELFDGNTDTIFDRNAAGYAGMDFGTAEQIMNLRYFLRNDSGWGGKPENGTTRGVNRSVGFTFEGANTEDFSDAVPLYTLTSNSLAGAWNDIPVTNTTPFRYIRIQSGGDYNKINIIAELDFVKASDFTANGTPKYWLAEYGLTPADDDLDNDADGLLTWEEYVAGTIPTDPNSVLVVESMESVGTDIELTWQSVEGKSYSVITNTSLTIPVQGVAVSNIVGQATNTTYMLPAGARAVFYQIGVE
ncbi:fibronectin type III domain-containing protein [Pontiellaceae bacterium B12219]|nr:fibronectin type III domain-containing protein [Pontiellaceae bacterium B12219]